MDNYTEKNTVWVQFVNPDFFLLEIGRAQLLCCAVRGETMGRNCGAKVSTHSFAFSD